MAKKSKSKKVVEKKDEEEEVVDYAAGADAFAGPAADSSDEEKQASSSEEEEEHDHVQKNEDTSDDDDDESSDDSQDEQDKGDDDDDDAEEEESDDDELNADIPKEFEQPKSATGEPCTFDLRNLLAMNAHQINTKTLYSNTTKARTEPSVAIPAMQLLANITVNEEELLEKATDGCTQLIAALWQLPKERSSAGPMVLLPSSDESRIPRALVRFRR